MGGDLFRTLHDGEQSWFERAVMESPFPIMLSAEDGEVILVNGAWEELTGFSREDIPTVRDWAERVYDAEVARTARHEIDSCFASGCSQIVGECRIRAANGELLTWDFGWVPIGTLPDGRRFAMSTGRDVTKIKAAEEEALREETRLQSVLDNAPFGAHLYELTLDDRLVFVGYNRRAEDMLGVDHAPLIGKTLEEAFPGNVGTETPEAYRRVAREGIVWETDQYAYDAAGIAGVFEVIAFPYGPDRTTVFFRDVTEKRRLEIALRDSEVRYGRLFENVQEGFAYCRIVTNVAGEPCDLHIRDANAAFERLTGLSDVADRGLLDVYPGIKQAAPGLLESACRVGLGGPPEVIELRDLTGLWRRYSFSSPEKQFVVWVAEDIDAHKRAEEALARTSRALRALSGVNAAVVRAHDEEELLRTVCDTIILNNSYSLAWVGFAQHDEPKSVVVAHSSGASSDYVASLRISWGDGEHGRGPTGRSIRAARPQIMRDMDTDPRYLPWREAALARGFRASLSLPLFESDGQTAFGALVIYSNDRDAFDDDETALLAEMAEDLAYGILALRARSERGEMARDLVHTNERLEGLLHDITETMGKVVEARDPYTQGHQVNVARIGRQIGEEMGLSDDLVDAIEIAALVHDIGKLSIPAEILSKPGRLSDTEFAIIKGHSARGYEILRDIDFGWPIAETVLQHHERMDGSGYPNGLTGEQTSMAARVLAVADVIEAMAADRPYRPALGIEPAITEIRTHPEKFDADVIDASVRLYESGRLAL